MKFHLQTSVYKQNKKACLAVDETCLQLCVRIVDVFYIDWNGHVGRVLHIEV